MRLGYAFLARSAEVSGQGCFSALGADLDQIGIGALPAMIPPIALVTKVWFGSNELGTHSLRVDITDPTGKSIGQPVSVPIEVGPNRRDPREESGALLVAQIAMELRFPGSHLIHVAVDEQEVTTVPLHVVLATPGDHPKGEN